jgi:hypothetical protein
VKAESLKVKGQNYILNIKTFALYVLVFSFEFCVLSLTPPQAGAQYKIIYTQESVTQTGEIAEKPIDFGVKVTAVVPGEWWLELQGWTSPFAIVELNMEQIIKRVTTADSQGQFTFRVALPRTIAPLCLIATDVSGISSYPLCIAPPPPEFNILIKEVVMPPTLKIEEGKLAKGETVPAQGYTTPNSEITPYLFEEQVRPRFRLPWSLDTSHWSPVTDHQSLITLAYAAEVPKFSVKSDQNGFFQFNLPSEAIGKNRIFVGSIFLNSPSPKSATLVFNVLSWWRMILERLISYILFLIALLLRLLAKPEGVILLETAIISGIIYLLLIKDRKNKLNSKS